jgi:hypothetical protein
MLSLLTDEEFSNRLHELRSQLDSLKSEADARRALFVATELESARGFLSSAVEHWDRRNRKAEAVA